MRATGRPRSFDRSIALERATDIFWRQGYDGTSLVDLSSAMGIAQSSLYAAFGSKLELFTEATDTYMRQYAEIFIRACAEESTAAGAATRILHESVDRFTADGQPAGCLTTSAAMSEGLGRSTFARLWREGSGPMHRFCETALRRQSTRGSCRATLSQASWPTSS